VLDVEGHEEQALLGILEVPKPALPKIFCIEDTIADNNNILNLLRKDYIHHSKYYNNSIFIKT
jgi:hypothetical protein